MEDEKLKDLLAKYQLLEPQKISEWDLLYFCRSNCDSAYDLVQIKKEEDIDIIIALYDYLSLPDCNELHTEISKNLIRNTCLESLHYKTKLVIKRRPSIKYVTDNFELKEHEDFDVLFTLKEFKERISKLE